MEYIATKDFYISSDWSEICHKGNGRAAQIEASVVAGTDSFVDYDQEKHYDTNLRKALYEAMGVSIEEWVLAGVDVGFGNPTREAYLESIKLKIVENLTKPGQSIDEMKALYRLKVDKKTPSIIGRGFTFNNVNFSLSAAAQFNWLWIKLQKSMNALDDNFEISTKEGGVYVLKLSEVDAFIAAGESVVSNALKDGRSLRDQINAYTSMDDFKNFADNR